MTAIEFPILSTDSLILDQLIHSDASHVFKIFSDSQVVEHYDVDKFKTELDAIRLIKHFDVLFESNSGIRWAIRDKNTMQLIGSCGFVNWNPFDHTAVISYELATEYWGRGYASQAVTAMINHVFAESFQFYVHRIEAYISPSNLASEKLIKKHKFEFEGTLREKSYWGDAFHDMNMFSLLNREWSRSNS
ncbi:GNAT family protein [Paraglaciecola aquimarina]|uniref:GNAT family protein n=1 Tax=Paraglaciecola aquimarina TaxID=1235557 RepID=A0ABU3STU1_9ALTE|nr:GNAT family protein [Paraglaciecola aquimarina]MDU0353425.1 GNAT family protein [Paraglaciecola aquimarina]